MAIQSASRTAGQTAQRLFSAAAILLVALLTIFLYTFFHELGHALVSLGFGGKITSFDVYFWNFNPHVGLTGQFAGWQRSLVSVAGIGLPLLLWMAFLLLFPRHGEPLLEWFKVLGSMMVINSLLPWIVIPFLFLTGRQPSDDSTSFLINSGIPPLLVAALSLGIYLYGWALLLNRVSGLPGLRERIRLAPETFSGSPRTLRGFGLTLLLLALVTAAIQQFYPFADALAAPDGYQQVFALDFSEGAPASPVAYTFTLEEDGQVSLFFALKDVRRGPARITLAGENGYQNTFLRAPAEFSTEKSTVHPQHIPLEAGAYRVEIDLPQSSAQVTGFILFETQK